MMSTLEGWSLDDAFDLLSFSSEENFFSSPPSERSMKQTTMGGEVDSQSMRKRRKRRMGETREERKDKEEREEREKQRTKEKREENGKRKKENKMKTKEEDIERT